MREGPHRDLGLVRRLVAEDPSAVREFVERCSCIIRFLFAVNRRYANQLDRHSLEDLAQKVFLEVWSQKETYRGEASLETWIWHFCYLQYLAFLQSPQRPRTRPESEEELQAAVAEDPDPGEEISARFDRLALARALSELAPAKRALIERKHFDNLTFEEMAASEGVPVSTLKDRYYQALAELQKLSERWRGRIEKEAPAKPGFGLLNSPEEEPGGFR